MLADRIIESPLKRCKSCRNCKSCNSEKTEIIKNNLNFDPEVGYSIAYHKNGLLESLPTNENETLAMMKRLETKPIKNELVNWLNECLLGFLKKCVISSVSLWQWKTTV